MASIPTTSIPSEAQPGKLPGFTLNISQGMQFLTLVSPFFVVFFFVMNSIINSNIQGFIYLFGLIFLFAFIKIIQKSRTQNYTSKNNFCVILEKEFGTHPSIVSALYCYTIIYLLIPMIQSSIINYPLLLLLFILYGIDTVIRFYLECTKFGYVLLGGLCGSIVAVGWYFVLSSTGNKQLLYYNNFLSNKQTCSKPSKEKFKCSVFKNGQLLQTI
jgi:hypothetical protein